MQIKTNITGIFVMLLFVFFLRTIKGQTDCLELLDNSNQAYADGKYELVVTLLEGNIYNCNLSKLEIEQAIKILSSAYIKLEENELADELVFNMLKKNPNFQVQITSDPMPFITVFNRFTCNPRLSVGLNIGQNLSLVIPLKTYPVSPNEELEHTFASSPGFVFSVYSQYILNNKVSIMVEPAFSFISFQENFNYTGFVNISYSERSPCLQLPVIIVYKFYQQKKISLSVLGGLRGSVTGKTESKLSYQVPGNGTFNATGFESLQRKQLYTGWQTGLRFEYNKVRYNFNLQTDFGSYFKNYEVEGYNFSNNNLLTDYNYYPGHIKLQFFDIKLGVFYILRYHVKQKYASR